jgi:hypothetical protein
VKAIDGLEASEIHASMSKDRAARAGEKPGDCRRESPEPSARIEPRNAAMRIAST